jgi:hypothetical protein
MFRSSVVSLFWNLLAHRKRESGFTLSDLASKVGVHKSSPSRWFGDSQPNFEANTMVDIANALDVDLEIYARDRKTGQRWAAYGLENRDSPFPKSGIDTNIHWWRGPSAETKSSGPAIILSSAA